MAGIHVVVGASGQVGIQLAKLLKSQGKEVRTVSRRRHIDELKGLGITHISADVTDRKQCLQACEGASHIYYAIGLSYDIKVWQANFPITIGNCITAAEENKAVLVHADNLYCYDPGTIKKQGGVVTVDTPFIPSTKNEKHKKNFLRACLNKTLQETHDTGRCRTTIVQASDFYGPGCGEKAHIGDLVFGNLVRGKSGLTVMRKDLPHDFTYIEDFARALAIAAENQKAWGKSWIVPNAPTKSLSEIVALSGLEKQTVRELHPVIRSMSTLFMTQMREIEEEIYQYRGKWVVESDFGEVFPEFGEPTSLEVGVAATVQWFQNNK